MKKIDVGEFQTPFTLHDILSGLIQSLDEKLVEFVDGRPSTSREELREEFRRLTALYLWDLLRQIKNMKAAKRLLAEAFEEWLDMACNEILSDALKENKHQRIQDFSQSEQIN